jgi:hypothetical protein
MLKMEWHGWDCILQKGRYIDNSIAILLFDAHDGEPVSKATVAIDGANLKENQIIVKDYSENEGMLDALISIGLVTSVERWIETGYVRVPVCNIDPAKLDEIDEYSGY